jgi:hypothetical protein
LRRLLALAARGDVARHIDERRLIRVDYDRECSAVVGMFFGTAAICEAIRLRRRMFPQTWIPDPVAGALTLAYVLGCVSIGRGDELFAGEMMGIELDGEAAAARRHALVMVTTLRRIFLGSSPFWGDGSGGLRLTDIRSPATGLVRHAHRILYGRDRGVLPAATYHSATADRIAFTMSCPFNLDGEFYQPKKDTQVILTASNTASFVRC